MMLRAIVNYFSFFVAGLLLIGAAAVVQLWPTSYWFEVRSVRVFDAKAGEPVLMAVDRTIKRDFRGEWIASIRRLEKGGWTSYCTAHGSTNYGADSQLPDPLTLKWWTYPGCHPLEPGKYTMKTTWTVKGIVFGMGMLPEKDVSIETNIFEIKP